MSSTADMMRSLAPTRLIPVPVFELHDEFITLGNDLDEAELSSTCAMLTDLTLSWKLKGAAPLLSAEGCAAATSIVDVSSIDTDNHSALADAVVEVFEQLRGEVADKFYAPDMLAAMPKDSVSCIIKVLKATLADVTKPPAARGKAGVKMPLATAMGIKGLQRRGDAYHVENKALKDVLKDTYGVRMLPARLVVQDESSLPAALGPLATEHDMYLALAGNVDLYIRHRNYMAVPFFKAAAPILEVVMDCKSRAEALGVFVRALPGLRDAGVVRGVAKSLESKLLGITTKGAKRTLTDRGRDAFATALAFLDNASPAKRRKIAAKEAAGAGDGAVAGATVGGMGDGTAVFVGDGATACATVGVTAGVMAGAAVGAGDVMGGAGDGAVAGVGDGAVAGVGDGAVAGVGDGATAGPGDGVTAGVTVGPGDGAMVGAGFLVGLMDDDLFMAPTPKIPDSFDGDVEIDHF